MDAPKCRLCGTLHYGLCPIGVFSVERKSSKTKCGRGACNAETYLAEIAALKAKLAKFQGIKNKRKPASIPAKAAK